MDKLVNFTAYNSIKNIEEYGKQKLFLWCVV